MSKTMDKFLMPEFSIDTTYNDKGKKIPGIKRMYDIALAIGDSVMQWSGPGTGKSSAVKQWNAQKVREYEERIKKGEKVKPWNPEVCDVRLSMKEPVDLIGVPTIRVDVNNEKGIPTTVWATPSMWPKDDGKFSGGVIHLDEINQGQAAILNAAFQLIQDRALGEYKVPEGYLIIGSANPAAYNSTVTEFSVPLSNRFTHFNIRVDFESWLNHRMNHNGNIDVMTFLKTQGEGMLYDRDLMQKQVGNLDEAMYTDIVITPRSWEVVEKVMSLPEGDETNGGFTIEEKHNYCTGRLGLSVASRFFTWLKDKTKYQDWHEILEDGKPFRDEESEQFWAVQMACMSAIINCNDDEKCRKYVLNLISATTKLKSPAYKVINATQLCRCPRLKGNIKVFNPIVDAGEIIKYAVVSLD